MISPMLVLALGAVLLLGALPALVARRDEARAARGMAVAALVALWYAAFDWPTDVRLEEPAALHVVATGSGDGPWLARTRAALAPDETLTVHAAGGAPLAAAGLAAALRARDPRDVVMVWDGPFEVADRAPPDGGPGGRAFTVVPRAAVEPGDVAVRVLGPMVTGRPGALEIDVDAAARRGWTEAGSVRLRVLDSGGAVVVDTELAASEFAERVPRVPWTPAVAGTCALELELRSGLTVVRAAGSLEVGPEPSPVLVVGPGASVVVAALAAQQVDAVAVGELPDDLPAGGVVIATATLDDDAQRRLDDFCDLGGGLILVGGPGGGALPPAGAPLAVACPLVRLPEPPDGEAAGAGDGAPGTPGADQEADPSQSEAVDPARPETEDPAAGPPPERPDQPEQPEEVATGDTSAARQSRVEEVEVERRSVALVLIVDRSGSMSDSVRGTASRMDYAKRSAFETAVQLEDGDELGIIAFGSRPYDVLELGPIPGSTALRRSIEALRATDRETLLGGAVERAGEWLVASRAPVRHAVVITDGDRLDPGDLRIAQSAARRMAGAGVTVSLIQIAATRFGPVSEIANIANFGNGQFVRETDGSAIPRLVFAEVRRALGAAGRQPRGDGPGGAGSEGDPSAAVDDPLARSEAETSDPRPDPDPGPSPEAAVGPDAPTTLRVIAIDESPLLAPEPAGGYPDLGGANAVVASPGALVLLATIDGTPLLAFGHRGLGRIAAWASDWSGPWSAAWRDDPAFPSRVATWVAAVRPSLDLAPDVDRLGGPRSLEPAAPTRAEWTELTARSGGSEPQGFDVLRPEPPRARSVARGRAADLAFAGLLALLLLALVEWRTRLA